jgi:hypothetical protein
VRHPERAALEHVLVTFDKERDLVTHLAHNYEQHDLEYAQERIALETGRVRSWNALLLGGLDKLGIVPLAVIAYISWQKLHVEQPLIFSGVPGGEWVIGAVLGFFYLLSMQQFLTCLELDRFCLVLKHAVEAKKLESPALNADTSIQLNLVSPSLAHDKIA